MLSPGLRVTTAFFHAGRRPVKRPNLEHDLLRVLVALRVRAGGAAGLAEAGALLGQ
jgi:hypothetical protein